MNKGIAELLKALPLLLDLTATVTDIISRSGEIRAEQKEEIKRRFREISDKVNYLEG